MNIIQLEEVSSTNLYAKENLDSFEDKTVIIAISQTSGRGRFDRKWVDLGEGNLFMTIVLKPSNLFEEVYANLTQYLSVVLTKILEEYGLSPFWLMMLKSPVFCAKQLCKELILKVWFSVLGLI